LLGKILRGIVVEMKKRNPRFGYLRISLQIKNFVLDNHYQFAGRSDGLFHIHSLNDLLAR